jgi:hypothetical protein
MNIKKILIGGVLLLGISPCMLMSGEVEIKPYYNLLKDTKKIANGDVVTIGNYGNKIDRKKVYAFGVSPINTDKIVIKQIKNPCFFIDKEDWEIDKGIKINSNTVSFEYGVGTNANPYDSFDNKTRPSLGHNLIFNSNDKITNKLDGREVIQVLGTDRNCYLRPTVEDWTFYTSYKTGSNRGKFKEVGKVKFYLK